MLTPWKKSLTNLSRDIILSTKVHLVNAMVFSVVMYGCESWIVKKAECWTDAFELWCWRRLLRVPWTARRSNQSILKEISPEYPLEGLMLKLKLQSFGHLMQRTDFIWKDPDAGKDLRQEEKGTTGWGGWMASPTQWTWVWVNSRSWWWTGMPGVPVRARHDWMTELIPTSICVHMHLMLFYLISLWWSVTKIAPKEPCLLESMSLPSDSSTLNRTNLCTNWPYGEEWGCSLPPTSTCLPAIGVSPLETIWLTLGQLNFMRPQVWSIQKSQKSIFPKKCLDLINAYCFMHQVLWWLVTQSATLSRCLFLHCCIFVSPLLIFLHFLCPFCFFKCP